MAICSNRLELVVRPNTSSILVFDVVLNAMNGLKYAYDEAAERAGLAAQERVFFDQCFDGLEATVRMVDRSTGQR